MPDRSKDWLEQARRDLNHAESACKDRHFEWSCFSSQQAAEKAVKALYINLHADAWGHSVYTLLGKLDKKLDVSEDLINAAKVLDKHYIPTRYPNGFDTGAPGDYYTESEAQNAIQNARQIIQFCQGHIR